MKVTAQDLKSLGVIDGIVPEPLGGAHREPSAAIGALGDAIAGALGELDGLDAAALREDRRAKFLARSEEHTSELQSLMRSSYAVFCLTKKKRQKQRNAHATK